MLDVDGGPDLEAVVDQFLDVDPALLVLAPFGVGVGQFVYQKDVGPPFEGGVDIEFMEGDVFVFDGFERQDFEAFRHLHGRGPIMGFDVADDDILPLFLRFLGCPQHGVGLPNTGGIAEVNPKFSSTHGHRSPSRAKLTSRTLTVGSPKIQSQRPSLYLLMTSRT